MVEREIPVKKRKHSVATKIANYLLLIIVFASFISLLSLIVMQSNKSDAELINVSGSLRMQSYRILYDIQHNPQSVAENLEQYRATLYSNTLLEINDEFFIPSNVKQAYKNLIECWSRIEFYAQKLDYQAYQKEVNNYVEQVDEFVYNLQQFSERKHDFAALFILFTMLSIIVMVSYVVWFTKKRMVYPLEKLALASTQVQTGLFNHIPLEVNNDNEIGRLSSVFTQMASDLQKLYTELEEKVNEKTHKLRQANRSLSMLYQCSQLVTTNNIDPIVLKQVLNQIKVNEDLGYIELSVYGAEHWHIYLGENDLNISLQKMDLCVEGEKLGTLYWQADLPGPDLRTMHNVSQMLSRSLYFHNTQRQHQQLLLMEERSIIARELHDSLAQVLTYLQIQLTLLKYNLNKEEKQNKEKSLTIIHDFEQALNGGYAQLRELLATFRLIVQEENLQLALEQVIDSLRNQTEMKMRLECRLPSQTFNAQQLVHALQIVREAALNAIKHSQGTEIEVIAHTNDDGEYELLVRDNGVGIRSLDEPAGHYGLNIMNERSTQLNAILSINNRPEGGTEVKITLPNKL